MHACLGCSLHVDRELVGILTLDALDEHAFDDVHDSTIRAFAALAAATLRNVALIRALEQASGRQRAISRDLMQEAFRREGNLIGNGRAMRHLRQEIAVAATDLAVLITGETGTGKELVARTTCSTRSSRSEQALVQINCATAGIDLAESELFGHRKGAFTGAVAERAGKFELAHGGTLFLDEIEALPLSLQAKLLRALQQGEIQRVGADEIIRVDVRLIAATNRDLQREVEEGRFRNDLYHRLHVYPIAVPPLREHREDLPVLAGYFLDMARHKLGITRIDLHPQTFPALAAYDWPGNVRELEHLLLRASLKAAQREPGKVVVRPDDLGLSAASVERRQESHQLIPELPTTGLREAVETCQRQMIAAALGESGGNWTQAAKRLGLDGANLQGWRAGWEFEPRPDSSVPLPRCGRRALYAFHFLGPLPHGCSRSGGIRAGQEAKGSLLITRCPLGTIFRTSSLSETASIFTGGTAPAHQFVGRPKDHVARGGSRRRKSKSQ